MRLRLSLVMLLISGGAAWGGELTMISSCPTARKIPVKFKIDCSRLRSDKLRGQCAKFIKNQACIVSPAYRKITGIRLEERCKSITYTIYENKIPNANGAGGRAYDCRVDYQARYALSSDSGSGIGPYDLHELLHHYQFSNAILNGISAAHPLYASTMQEARYEVGDRHAYASWLPRMDEEAERIMGDLRQGRISSKLKCRLVRVVVDEKNYLADPTYIYQTYRDLAAIGSRSAYDAERQLNTIMAKRSAPGLLRLFEDNRCPLDRPNVIAKRLNEPSVKVAGSERQQEIRKPKVFPQPHFNGLRLDSRATASSQFDMQGTANRFCQSKGFEKMLAYKVQTARKTIAIGDGNVFRNGARSNTAYRFISCQ